MGNLAQLTDLLETSGKLPTYLRDESKIEEAFRKYTDNLISDVEQGRIKPQAIYPMNKLLGFHYRYGMTDHDDIVFLMAPVEEIQRYNPSWTVPGIVKMFSDPISGKLNERFYPFKEVMCFRINPEKYNFLFG